MQLANLLSEITFRYTYERARKFAGSEFANYVRHDLAVEAKKSLFNLPFELKVKASVGAGNWASVPWLGFFDPLVTESATKGYYVVFLVNAYNETFILSMNQGATSVYSEYGQIRGRELLRRRAIDIADRVPEFSGLFEMDQITLGSKDALPAGYEAGHSFGRTYSPGGVTNESLLDDLRQMLFAYEMLVNRGGFESLETMREEAGTNDIEETRRYVLSRRIERTARVRRQVLAARGVVCEACGLNPALDYKYTGKPLGVPLDVHHTKPIAHLAEGETKRYRVPDDFLVLCPNCHRMIHKQNDPSDIEKLRTKIGFHYLRAVGNYPVRRN